MPFAKSGLLQNLIFGFHLEREKWGKKSVPLPYFDEKLVVVAGKVITLHPFKMLTTMGKVTIVIFVTAIIILALCSCSVLSKKSIWEKDDLSLFEYIFDKLSDKSDFGSDLSSLNEKEKVFMSMALLEQEVNNGGFDQYFLNLGGKYNDILVSSAEAIKAYDIAEICKKALAVYAEGSEQDEIIEELNEYDNAFYESKDAISNLCVQYAKENKKYFEL